MAHRILRLAGAIIVLLTCVEALGFGRSLSLPLGGSPVAEMAIIFGLAFVLLEFWYKGDK